MEEAVCLKCNELIRMKKDLYVLLGTYDGEDTVREDYFHMQCWREHFEECARQKAEAVVNGYQDKMMPVAQQMTDKLKQAIAKANEQEAVL